MTRALENAASSSLDYPGNPPPVGWRDRKLGMFVRLSTSLVGLLGVLFAQGAFGQTSSLWGQQGELWNPAERLGDFSFAGYRTGNVVIPDRSGNRVSVASFGAIANDDADDTAAFKSAIAAAQPGQAVYAPAGTYDLYYVLEIRKGGISLQGAGQGQTVLYFHKSLRELRSPQSSGIYFPIDAVFPCQIVDPPPKQLGLDWSFSGGMIWIQGQDPTDSSTRLTTVVQGALRGATMITVASTAGISAGMWIRLTETDPPRTGANSGTLARHLHGDLTGAGCEQTGRQLVDFRSRVSAISGNTLTLERPLPVEVRTLWRPEVHRYAPTVQDVGVEKLTLKFPEISYAGHFNEPGYNGIYLTYVSNVWIRDVEILNADSGVFANWAYFTTFDDVSTRVGPGRTGGGGHHAYDIHLLSADNLVTRFNIAAPYIHDLSTEQYGSGNVFSAGTGYNINLDHHMASPHQNLYTDISLGRGLRPFESGGGGNRGPNTTRYSTLWNVRADNDIVLPTCAFGPMMTFVGVGSSTAGACSSMQWWVEKISPGTLQPQNLHQAQLARRIGGAPRPDTTPPPTPLNLRIVP